MSKKNKFHFGIFEDGKNIKIAQLQMQKNSASLVSLQKEFMDSPLYAGAVLKKKNFEQGDVENNGPINLNEQSDDFDLDQGEDLHSKFMSLEYLLRRFPLNSGKLALNANNDKLNFHTLNLPQKKITRSKLVELEILKPYEKRDKNIQINFIPNVNDQTTIVVHRGENKLFSFLQDFNKKNAHKKYFYSLIDCNDILLTDYLKNSKELAASENTLLLYLGHEYKKGIFMEGNSYKKSFPIMTSANSFDIKEEIYSKLMLMEDEEDLPEFSKLIIAGDYSKDEDIAYFSQKYENIEVKRATFENFPLTIDPEIGADEIAAYIIPIMLAMKSMHLKTLHFITSNFLSPKVIESQKPFKIGWHGFVILAVIFLTVLYLTNSYLNFNQQLNQMVAKNKNLEQKLQSIKQDRMIIQNVQKQINQIIESDSKITNILENKNKWTYIMNKFAYAVATHPKSWLTNVKSEKNGFITSGITDDRENIIYFSKLFPNSNITSVDSETLEGREIWSFDISYDYPAISTFEIIEKKEKSPPPDVTPVKTMETKNNSVNTLYRQITNAYYQGDRKKVINLARKLIEKYPQDELALNSKYLIGELIYQEGKTEEALQLFNQVIEAKNNMAPFAMYMKAKLMANKGQNQQAIEQLQLLMNYYTTSSVLPKAKKLLRTLEGAQNE
jgi:TolA-binding protein